MGCEGSRRMAGPSTTRFHISEPLRRMLIVAKAALEALLRSIHASNARHSGAAPYETRAQWTRTEPAVQFKVRKEQYVTMVDRAAQATWPLIAE